MKIFGKATVVSGAVLALAFTALGPTTSANANGASTFRLKSAVTGKCLQWNGPNKAITLATCKKKNSQYWGQVAEQIASYADPYGGFCLGIAKKIEKAPVGRYCYEAPGARGNDFRYNHTTYLAAAGPGYPSCNFKTVSKKVVCGKRTKTLKPMQWVVTA
ncbi:hypothetical protein ACH4PW_13970 [Streptomyces sp. NPDC017082]|uniref:hypothetical protein n=1 Tax=Streptomyces sp. NPDC017082 TaxID=3364974 RepID=UPI0037995227